MSGVLVPHQLPSAIAVEGGWNKDFYPFVVYKIYGDLAEKILAPRPRLRILCWLFGNLPYLDITNGFCRSRKLQWQRQHVAVS